MKDLSEIQTDILRQLGCFPDNLGSISSRAMCAAARLASSTASKKYDLRPTIASWANGTRSMTLGLLTRTAAELGLGGIRVDIGSGVHRGVDKEARHIKSAAKRRACTAEGVFRLVDKNLANTQCDILSQLGYTVGRHTAGNEALYEALRNTGRSRTLCPTSYYVPKVCEWARGEKGMSMRRIVEVMAELEIRRIHIIVFYEQEELNGWDCI